MDNEIQRGRVGESEKVARVLEDQENQYTENGFRKLEERARRTTETKQLDNEQKSYYI